MDNVQKHNICTIVPSAETSRSYLHYVIINIIIIVIIIITNIKIYLTVTTCFVEKYCHVF
jgi:hypothetical protein